MSDNSMSVHSLIDKFSEPSPAPLPKGPHPHGRRILTPNSQTGIASLLGPNITTWPYSEEAFMTAISYRTEQEKTKQELYRLELANKNLDILKSALQANIPSHLIPLIYSGSIIPPESDSMIQQYQQPQAQQRFPPNIQMQDSFRFPASPSQPNIHDQQQQQQQMAYSTYNANPAPPLQYRFGNPNTLSPAKMGAAAVASLTQDRKYQLSSPTRHQRHYSLPPTSSSIPERSSTEFKSPKKSNLQPSHKGVLSPIQVKPMPSQPPRNNQPPSQESMTSLQHVIQFHHWTPEETGSPSVQKTKNMDERPAGKRRRSNSEFASGSEPSKLNQVGEIEAINNSGTVNTASSSNLASLRRKGHSRTQSESILQNRNEDKSALNELAEAATKEKGDKFPNNILSG